MFTKDDLWETANCPAPDYCNYLDSDGSNDCEQLTAITDQDVLSLHLLLDGSKNQLHAVANPNLSAADRAKALLIYNEPLQVNGSARNPSLLRSDFPAIEEWDFALIEGLGRRTDIITEEDQEYFFTTSTNYTVWISLMGGQLTPKVERLLLEHPGSITPMKEAWARRERASAEYLRGCLNLQPSPGAHRDDIEELWFIAAKHRRLSIEAIFTIPLKDDFTERALVENAEDRSEEALSWIQENYPELTNVPFSWARNVLAGSATEDLA